MGVLQLRPVATNSRSPVESESESSKSSYSFADKGGQCGGGDDIGDSGAGVLIHETSR